MPPTADKNLEERIMKAAQRLWQVRGARGLTLRAVARAAGTTTPTVYKRFRNKQALQIALALRFASSSTQQLFSALRWRKPSKDMCALRKSILMNINCYGAPGRISFIRTSRAGRSWFLARLADRFGGAPEGYGRAFYAFFS